LVREALERAAPKPWFVARLAPPGVDARAIAQAAAAFDALVRLQALTQRVLADRTAEPHRYRGDDTAPASEPSGCLIYALAFGRAGAMDSSSELVAVGC
jgi:hypothetical protein